ncbi:MAG: glycoside hydrolase family 3 C-terminal domain-containing protein [Eubacteriales bacterium]|nr:glycoside hydrolase family 3 C-terminal domain-containing protein [Eubacteriales bacterium]
MDIERIMKQMTLREKAEMCVDGSMLRTAEMPQHGIPKLIMTDGTSGVRLLDVPDEDPKTALFIERVSASFDSEDALAATIPATCFPAGSSIACGWDAELAARVGSAIAEECKSLDAGLLYGPAINTRRTPLDGRGFEYFSEDPCLAGDLSAAFVNGLQANGVAASIKHFVCNDSNYLRTISDSVVEERALREIYLAAFERVVKNSHPATVMGSYNKINGVQACENKWLLTDVLRNDWGYEGVIISDCGAVKDHLAAFRAGLDFEMPYSKIAIDKLVAAVESGEMTEAELDARSRRVIDLALTYAREGKEKPVVDFQAHHALAREAAEKCAVLLKNEDHILPLDAKKTAKIAILGDWAEHPVFQGTGCAIVNARQIDIPLDEMRQIVSDPSALRYEPGYLDLNHVDETLLSRATEAARQADVAIIFAGSILPEESDDYNRKHMNVEPAQEELIRRVSAVNANTVVVLMNCESVVMPWIDHVKAVLDMWYCGEGCGNAVAKLLFGVANPSGKLPVTIPVRQSDIPGYLHFPGENHTLLYEEGVFVGYRYYEKKELAPLFPFGHGLSYTSFAYRNLRLSTQELILPDQLTVRFTLTNTGNLRGGEVPQLYIADGHARLPRPAKELKHFTKVYLDPGESAEISFTLDARDFAYFDPAFSDWVVDSGSFELIIGSSSQDVRLRADVRVIDTTRRALPITSDSHYLELFQNDRVKQAYFDTLIEWGFITREDVTPALEKHLRIAFWGLKQHLDLLVPYRISEEKIEVLVERLNQAARL